MKIPLPGGSALAIMVVTLVVATTWSADAPIVYPKTRASDVVNDYHGTKVADPYAWLEDLGSPETKAWIEAQNAVTASYLGALPVRDRLRTRLTELWNYPRTGVPDLEAGVLFYFHNTGLERQARLFTRTSLTAEPKLLVDPNTLSPDGSVAFSEYAPSPDAAHIAYGLSQGGADWRTVHVREVATGKDLPDSIEWVRFSAFSWTKDGKGFFYARFPEPPKGQELSAALEHHQLYYHKLGTAQKEDRLVFERRDLPKWFVGGAVTEDGRYLLVTLNHGTDVKNRLFYADLGDPLHPNVAAPVVAIADEDIAQLEPVGNDGAVLLVRTDLDAPKHKLIAIDPRLKTGRAGWKTVVPEGEHSMEGAVVAGGKIFVSYLVDVKSEVRIFGKDGKAEGALALPGVGTVAGVSGRDDTPELFYAFTSPLYPTTVFEYDVKTGKSTPFDAPPSLFDPSKYETKQVFFKSKDGTRVPMFLTSKKGLPQDGTNPTWLTAYGGFDISIVPAYSPWVVAWLEMGGIFAEPNLRGGGEYGEAWHQAGMKEKKQNVFDDFLGAAEYLIAEKYTSSAKLAIEGGSNGGLLIGAAMTQRPDLFAVALPAVGVMDMLRYEKFTGGAAWASEYGSVEDPTAFQYIYKYSPLQNLKKGTCYPATLATTADHDDRVVPSHSYKYIATLQADQACQKPVLIRVETQGSHGYRPTDKLIAQRADIMAFVARQLGIEAPTPAPKAP
jgi:prolyl oligopeptidase